MDKAGGKSAEFEEGGSCLFVRDAGYEAAHLAFKSGGGDGKEINDKDGGAKGDVEEAGALGDCGGGAGTLESSEGQL